MEAQSGLMLSIDLDSRSHLSETAKWGKFLAIIGFIMCGLIVLFGLFFGTIMAAFSKYGAQSADLLPAMGAAMAVIYILLAILNFFPCLFLYRFSNQMQAALNRNDGTNLTTSFRNLKSLFKFIGIMMIITLAFYALVLVIALGMGSMTNFN